MKLTFPRTIAVSLAVAALALPLSGQTVTVNTGADLIDIDTMTATVADLPGPDGKISLSEALIATNNTPGHQTIGFAIPQEEWTLQFALPGRAVLQSLVGFYWRAYDEVTIDGTTQTAFTGDTNPDGCEVALWSNTLYLNADNCTVIGLDSSSLSVTGSNGLVEGNTGVNIDLFGGSGSLIKNNTAGTIKIDRSSDNVVVGNTASRVRVQGWDPVAANNRIGGPAPEDRNLIFGYGSYNSEGIPSGHAIQLFYTVDTLVENNWIGTADGLTIGNLACTIGISIESQNDNVLIKDNLISGIYGLGIGPHYPGTVWGRSILASGNGSGLTITGNVIGADINGDPLLGGAWGLDLGDPVTHKLYMTDIEISDNEIAGHILNGVTVGRYTQAVRLMGNSIHDNGWLGIDLRGTSDGSYGVNANDPLDVDTGGSGVQNYPELSAVLRMGADLRVMGNLHSSASDAFTLEFFASPACDDSGFGEGQLPLGTLAVNTDALGNAPFDATLTTPVPEGWYLTATATLEPLGATSEFSACLGTVWRDEGHALAGLAGDPLLAGEGDLTELSANELRLAGAVRSSLAGLFVALEGNPTPFKGGLLVPLPLVIEPVLLTTDSDGEIALPFTMPAGVTPGTEMWLQWAVQDGAAVQGVALSNALVGDVP